MKWSFPLIQSWSSGSAKYTAMASWGISQVESQLPMAMATRVALLRCTRTWRDPDRTVDLEPGGPGGAVPLW